MDAAGIDPAWLALSDMERPAVSVIVPAFNVGDYITQLLRSLSAQTLSDFEAIVVDDGSTDHTGAAVAAHAAARVSLIRQANQGVSAARNAGLAAARGAFVIFVDGDDLLHPQALERLAAALRQHPDAVASYGTFIKVRENGDRQPGQKPLERQRYPSGEVLARVIEQAIFANGGHVLLRRDVALAIGGFDRRLSLSEDWEFLCRAASRGEFVFIGQVPEVLYLRLRSGSLSRNATRSWEKSLPAIQAVLENEDLRRRFSPQRWSELCRRVRASHLWEFGRVSFCERRYDTGRSYMWRSLLTAPTVKRAAMLALSYPSQIFDVSLVGRLRFVDHDR
jgi:glycosyltransferase involved in cell wall biosynthesis